MTHFTHFVCPYKDVQQYNPKSCTWVANQFRVWPILYISTILTWISSLGHMQMTKFVSLWYSKMLIFILITTSSVNEIQLSFNWSLFLISIHQNIKSTTVLYIYNILEELPKALLNMIPIEVDRVTLSRRPLEEIF